MKNFFSRRFAFMFLALPVLLAVFVMVRMPEGHAVQSSEPSASVIKITPQMPANALKSLPDDALVELPSGRKIVMRDIRRLSRKAAEIKSATLIGKSMTQVFKVQPALTGTPLKNRADLVSALSRPDSDTVQLPSGRRLTVEQLRLLQPYVEKRLGRKLTRLEAPGLKGEAIKVTSSTDEGYWRDILRKPDHTILESPDGTRITVGDLKSALSATKAPGSPSTRVSP